MPTVAAGWGYCGHTEPADWLADLESTADTGVEAFRAAWKASREDFRAHLAADKDATAKLKARAEQADAKTKAVA